MRSAGGRITQRKDWVSGEEVTYQYDSLNRLISAQTTGPEWGQSFGYDGFGNLLSQTVTKGYAPSLNVTVDPATNWMTNQGASYDANGNLTAMPGLTMSYDTDNRMISNSSGDSYLYDASGQRVKKTNGYNTSIYFYGIDGNLLNVPAGYNVYFGSKLIYNGATVVTDRLGSVVEKDPWTSSRYFPYGDESSTTDQNRPKFATYYRDGSTALDYAQQRYYASTLGGFTSPDPYMASGGPADPQSWNRYAYVQNDPVNYYDPEGLCQCPAGSVCSCWDPRPSPTGSQPYFELFGQYGARYPDQMVEVDSGGGPAPPPDDPCDGIGKAISNVINGVGMPGGKSLALRIAQQIVGQGGDVYDGHEKQLNGLQRRLMQLLKQWDDSHCNGDPPGGGYFWVFATDPVQIRELHDLFNAGKLVAGSYLVYRLARLMPSLVPILWPTLPLNLATP